jgi:hypothetical protein
MLILSIYLLSQTDYVCEIYHTLTILPNRKKVKKKINIQRVTWHSMEVKHGSGRGDMWQVSRLNGQRQGPIAC